MLPISRFSCFIMQSFDLYFAPEPKRNSKCRTWDIKKVKAKLGSLICSHILFLHALLGCDTTSRLYNIGKSTILKKFKAKTILHHSAKIFNYPNSTAKEIKFAGEKALVNIYNGKSNESLNTLCYRRYCEKLATNTTQVEPRTLPPTSAAAKFHRLVNGRVWTVISQHICGGGPKMMLYCLQQ